MLAFLPLFLKIVQMVVNYSATLLLASLLIISSHHLICCQPPETFVTNSSISWINKPSYVVNSTDGATLTPILSREGNETQFVCGFLCDYNGTACILGVLLFPNTFDSYLYYPRLVWSANRNNPVRTNATLQLRQDRGLFLMDSDGTLIWSTNTSGKVVAGFNLTVLGNLVLFDKSNDTIWQSFDHPTDSLLPGQKLVSGQKLIASVSATNLSQGLFALTVLNGNWAAYTDTDPRQYYYTLDYADSPYYSFDGQTFTALQYTTKSTAQFMKIGPDGHLKDRKNKVK